MNQRFPSWVYRSGVEPDPRFSLANERTYLAWVRTALALVAGGVALESLGLPAHHALRTAASTILVLLGTTVPLLAWISWGRAERSMRKCEALPTSWVLLPVGAAVAVVGLLIAVAIIWG